VGNPSDGYFGKTISFVFDKRTQIYRIASDNIRMVEAARSTGASATFTGSGGAIVGAYADERMFAELRKALRRLSITVIKPQIVPGTGNAKA